MAEDKGFSSAAVPRLSVSKISSKSRTNEIRRSLNASSDTLNSPIVGDGHGHSEKSPGRQLTLEDALRSSRAVSVSNSLLDSESGAEEKVKRTEARRGSDPDVLTKCGVTSEAGARPENQDGWILQDPFAEHEGTVFAAVLDGHGPNGKRVAHFVMEALPQCLASQKCLLTDPEEALRRAFAETQSRLVDPASGLDVEMSGATATCVFISEGMIHVANVGDSRTVLGYRREGVMPVTPGGDSEATAHAAEALGAEPAVDKLSGLAARALTVDHKPEAPAERARIEAAGGRVCPFELRGKACGPPRVWGPTEWSLGLAVSRSFGDSAAAEVGVMSEPEVCTYELDPSCDMLILATDGVWDLIPNEDAVRIVANASRDRSPEHASMALTRSALAALQQARRKDNVTALVIFFTHAYAPDGE